MGVAEISRTGGVLNIPASGIFRAVPRKPYRTAERPYPNRIREWRVRRGYSIEEFADRVGAKRATVHRHETGGNEMTLAALERYARALTVTVENLLNSGARVNDDVRMLALKLAELAPMERQRVLRMLEAATAAPDAPPPEPAPATAAIPLRRVGRS